MRLLIVTSRRVDLRLFALLAALTLVFMASVGGQNGVQAADGDAGTSFVTFWSGDLRIIAHENDTEVTLINVDTGLPLPLPTYRVLSTNVASNPFTLGAGESFEGRSRTSIANEIRVRIESSDATGGGGIKPLTVWTGLLNSSTRHPANPPGSGNSWMSYLPASLDASDTTGRELGRSFLGFTTSEMRIVAKRGPGDTTIQIDDLYTNVDFDTDDTRTLHSVDAVFSDSEIEVFEVFGFEDDTVRVTGNRDMSVMVGHRSGAGDDWTASPPSFAAGEGGIELGTVFYGFVNRSLSVFPTEDDTVVNITNLSTGTPLPPVTLANGDTTGDYDIWVARTTPKNGTAIVPRASAPGVNIIDGGEALSTNNIFKVESNKPVLVYQGPVTSDTAEFADVAFSVPTGPDSRIMYVYAQNGGGSNDLQVFGFTDDTVVTITSLSHTAGFGTLKHSRRIGPGIGGPSTGGSGRNVAWQEDQWLRGTTGSDVWWGASFWHAEMLRIESNNPITVIGGDYDTPFYGAFIPFVTASTVTTVQPPVADAGEDFEATAGVPFNFDGSGSFDQDSVPGPLSPTYTWNFGDGSPDGSGVAPGHTYSSAGTFIVRLVFTDDEGQSDDDFVTVTVLPSPIPDPPPFIDGFPLPNDDTCICTPPLMVVPDDATHYWWARTTGNVDLSVTPIAVGVNDDEHGEVRVEVFDPTEASVGWQTVEHPGQGEETAGTPIVDAGTGYGDLYRIEVTLIPPDGEPVPNEPWLAHHYRLELKGASLLGTNSPLQTQAEPIPMTWGMNVGTGEDLDFVILPENLGGLGPIEVRNPFDLVVPVVPVPVPGGVQISIPSAVAGHWRISIPNAGGHYVIDKTTGVDRGIYINWRSFGSGSVNVTVTQDGGSAYAGPYKVKIKNLLTGDEWIEPPSGPFTGPTTLTLPVGEYEIWVVSRGRASARLLVIVTCNGIAEISLDLPRLAVDIDIKPGSDPNSLNLNGNGLVPVAVFGSPKFDVGAINIASVVAGVDADSNGAIDPSALPAAVFHDGHIEDVNNDGVDDIVFHFREFELGIDTNTAGNTIRDVLVVGELGDSTVFVGLDVVRITPNNIPNSRDKGGKGPKVK